MSEDTRSRFRVLSRIADIGKNACSQSGSIKELFLADFISVSLEEALVPIADIVPELEYNSVVVTKACAAAAQIQNKFTWITLDEISAIVLYTMEADSPKTSLCCALNSALYAKDESQLNIWRNYIWLLLHGLRKLPPSPSTCVFRGCRSEPKCLGLDLQAGDRLTWSTFSSASIEDGVIREFLGKVGDRTLIQLNLLNNIGRDITGFSLCPSQDEVLLPPGVSFECASHCEAQDGLVIIQADQVEPLDVWLNLLERNATAAGSGASAVQSLKKLSLNCKSTESLATDDANDPSISTEAPRDCIENESTTNDEVERSCEEWCNFGYAGGGEFRGVVYTKRESYEMALHVDITSVRAWYNLGTEGGGIVNDQPYSKKQCYQEALWLNPEKTNAWYNLGTEGGGIIGGTSYNEKDCYQNALSTDFKYTNAWYNLGVEGGGIVGGKLYSEQECYEHALDTNAKHVNAWYNLGIKGGGVVSGVHYSKADCYQEALKLNSKKTNAWRNLGIEGGGEVDGKRYTKRQCYEEALTSSDAKHADDWYNLGTEGGGTLDGKTYTKKECYGESLKSNPKKVNAWYNLGCEGGGAVCGTLYSEKGCYQCALESNPEYTNAWYNLGLEGGGQIHGQDYTEPECYCEALRINPRYVNAWYNLGIEGGGAVGGKKYSKAQCYQEALTLNPKKSNAWKKLAHEGGGIVSGIHFSKPECLEKAERLELAA